VTSPPQQPPRLRPPHQLAGGKGHQAPWRMTPHSSQAAHHVPGVPITGPLLASLPPQTQDERARPQFAGPSTQLTVAMSAKTKRPTDLPLKANLGEKRKVPAREPRPDRRRRQVEIDNVDTELVSYLKVESLFQDRTPKLALVLTGKGKRFLEKFDTTDITWERRRVILVAAVKCAMVIDADEDSLRQMLKNPDQQDLIQKQHDFLTKGKVGHSGPRFFGLGRDSTIPS